MRLDNYFSNPAQHIMIYGEPFTGKSTLAATVAELGFRVIWVSTDRGVNHLRKLPQSAQDQIELIILPDTRDNPCAYPTLMSMFKPKPITICWAHGTVRCAWCATNAPDDVTSYQYNKLGGPETVIVIDHLTQTAESALNIAVRYSIKMKEQDANKVTWDQSNMEEALLLYKPGYGQWQYLWNYMSELLNAVAASPNHVIVISHVVESRQEDGNKRLVPHGGSDRFSRTVPRYFDHVITTEVGSKMHKYSSATTADTNLIAGSRSDIDLTALFGKGGRPTLAPFFNGTIPKVEREYGIDAAAEVLKLPALRDGMTAAERISKLRAEREAKKGFGE